MYGIVSDLDCDWADNKRSAVRRAKELVNAGAAYCFIQKYDEQTGEFKGKPKYIKEDWYEGTDN